MSGAPVAGNDRNSERRSIGARERGATTSGLFCRGAICDDENAADLQGEFSDLTSICTLSDRLRANLSASKGRDVHDAEIIVASLHGSWAPFEGPTPTCKTGGDERPEVPFACHDTNLGVASSGDRYERFMRQFPHYYPDTSTGGDPDARLDFENFKEPGVMCSGDFSTPLGDIGAKLAGLSAR